jgi:hypothetical protein
MFSAKIKYFFFDQDAAGLIFRLLSIESLFDL